jgi:hypothetical protein
LFGGSFFHFLVDWFLGVFIMRTSSTGRAVEPADSGRWQEKSCDEVLDELFGLLHNSASLLLTNRKKRRSKLFKNLDNR